MYTKEIDTKDNYILGSLTLEMKKPWSKPYKTKQKTKMLYLRWQQVNHWFLLPHEIRQANSPALYIFFRWTDLFITEKI